MVADYCYGCMEPLEPGQIICPYCGYDNSTRDNQNFAMKKGSTLKGMYMVGKVLGKGGFGITYLGIQLNLNIKVAIKEHFPRAFCSRYVNTKEIVLLDKQNFYKSVEAFENEARTLAKFKNIPSVVRVTDYFEENNTAYIVMDYVEGVTLKDEIDRLGSLPWQRVVSLMMPLMIDLNQLHRGKVIHRDIKPDNIKIVKDPENGNERLVLLDFGAARFFTNSELTETLSMILTPGFAPYEQYLQHTHLGPHTDIYALCATIYKAITGVTPPAAPDRMSNDKLLPFSAFGLDVPEYIEKAVFHGMEREYKDRPQSIHELYEEFAPFLREEQERIAEEERIADEKQRKYESALKFMDQTTKEGFMKAAVLFDEVSGWKDADLLLQRCREKLDEIEKAEYKAETRRKKRIRLCLLLFSLMLILGAETWLLVNKKTSFSGEDGLPVLVSDQTVIPNNLIIDNTSVMQSQSVSEFIPEATATNTPRPTKTPQPTATNTSRPTNTPQPTATNTPKPTKTPEPTATNTPKPTNTPEPTATNTSRPTNTPEPTATNTSRPTNTPEPTATKTLKPTNIPEPTTTNTPKPINTPQPTATNTPKPINTVDPSSFTDIDQMVIVGVNAFYDGDYETALSYMLAAADEGHVVAQLYVGYMYENGLGIKESDEMAVHYYQMAADQGHDMARFYLGKMYYYGKGVKQSYEQAIQYYQAAADQGNTEAQNNLGYMYFQGIGVDKSYDTALEYYRMAANKGNDNAITNLGVMYEKGYGVEQSYEQALKYFRLAADYGNSTAQFNLGVMYEDGKGVKKSYDKALEYYRLAAAQGYEEALKKVEELLQINNGSL